MDRCSHDMPNALNPVVTDDQNCELLSDPDPVTSNACMPYPRVMAGKLASVPEPNSIRGKREMEKSLMCTGGLQISGERWDGSGFANELSARKWR